MATLDFIRHINGEWQTDVSIPVHDFDDAVFQLAGTMWESTGDMMCVIDYTDAFTAQREAEECLCGAPECGNVILPLEMTDGTLCAIVYAA